MKKGKEGVFGLFAIFAIIAIVSIVLLIMGFSKNNETITGRAGNNIENVPLTLNSEYNAAQLQISEILQGFSEKDIDLCQGALNRVLQKCSSAGYDGFVVQRMLSGYHHATGDILSYQDNIWGPRKCPSPESGKTEYFIHSEVLNSMQSTQDLEAQTGRSDQVACSISCQGWTCPENFDLFKDPISTGVCDPYTGKMYGIYTIDERAQELELVQQIGCRERGRGCDIRKPCKRYLNKETCQLRVECSCNCPFTETPGQNIDNFIRDAPKDPYREGIPDNIAVDTKPRLDDLVRLIPQREKDACLVEPCKVKCDDRDGDGRIDPDVATKAFALAGLNPMQAGNMQNLAGTNKFLSSPSATGPRCRGFDIGLSNSPPTPPPSLPRQTSREERPPTIPKETQPPDVVLPPQKDCNQLCAEKGLSKAACDAQLDFLSLVQNERCVSGAHFKKKQTILKDCGCCSEPELSVEIDRTPPVCQTPCGPVQCDSSATCSCGERCTMTASCKWGGWKSTGSGVAPQLSVGQEQS